MQNPFKKSTSRGISFHGYNHDTDTFIDTLTQADLTLDQQLPISVSPLTEAEFALDGGAMFGIVPKPLWTRTNPADDNNRIALACRCLLVQYSDRNVLVDVGIGTKWSEKERGIYRIENQDDGLAKSLATHGLSAADIDDVILTHLHFDHAGGLSRFDGEKIVPVFPNATHWVQKSNWGWANSPSARDGGSYRIQDFGFLAADDAPELKLVDGPKTILPGIDVHPMNGHTFGMQIVVVETSEQTFAHLADLIPTAAHLRDPYVMGYDLQPLVTVAEKRELLHRAAAEDWLLVFEHDPVTATGRVAFKNDKPVLV